MPSTGERVPSGREHVSQTRNESERRPHEPETSPLGTNHGTTLLWLVVDWSFLLMVAASLLVVWLVLIVLLWLFRPRDVALGQLVRVIPDALRLTRRLLGDRSVPLGVRLALVVLLVWLVSPVDVIPEFIPVLGPLDDVVVAYLVFRYVRRRLGDDELRRRWPGTPEGYELLTGAAPSADGGPARARRGRAPRPAGPMRPR